MPGETLLLSHAVRRVTCRALHCKNLNFSIFSPQRSIGYSTKCLQAVTTVAAAGSLTSPRQPLEQVFRAVHADAPRSFSIVLHTGYNASATDDAFSTTSYAVTDVQAFETLIHDALQVTPVKTTQPDRLTSTSTSSSSSLPSTTSTTLLANHTIRELQALLKETELALETPAKRKAEIDHRVYKGYLPLLKYGTFVLLSLQFVVYFNWIFFVFDWNLVEPTTYFLGYTGVFCSLVYHYYRCGEDDFTWRNLFQYLARCKAERLYENKKVDARAVAQLQRRIAEIKADLKQVTV